MSLDATKPLDTELVSMIPYWIRLHAAAFNVLEGLVVSGSIAVTTIDIPAGTVALGVGTDLSSAMLELVFATGAVPVTIASITAGTEGQVKILVFGDNEIALQDSIALAGGTFSLEQLPASLTYDPNAGDVIVLLNVGGAAGYWKEVYRLVTVK